MLEADEAARRASVTCLITATFDGDSRHQRAEYRYDALGRRTRKALYPHHGEPQTTLFHWNDLQMVDEHNPDQPQHSTQYLYREDSYEPLSHVDRHGDISMMLFYWRQISVMMQTAWRQPPGNWPERFMAIRVFLMHGLPNWLNVKEYRN